LVAASSNPPATRVHRCPINGCEATIHKRFLMCFVHWRMVPRPLQMRVYATYQRGQENQGIGAASDAYVEAMAEAIRIVNEQERAAGV